MNKVPSFLYFVVLATTAIIALPSCHHQAEEHIVVINGHRFVDLALPSGLLWAEANLGAQTENDAGDYYAWAETQTKADYSEKNYRYGSSFDAMTKYNDTDYKVTLDTEDDAASAQWGAPCHTPTQNEFLELADSANCSWTWTARVIAANDTVSGYEIKSKRNGKSIFLPAAGVYNGKNVELKGSNGAYWTSSLVPNYCGAAYDLGFYFANCSWYRNDRFVGHPVRAVATNSETEITDKTK